MKTSYEAAWELLLDFDIIDWCMCISLDLILKRKTKLTVWNKEVLTVKGLKFHENEFGSISRYTSVYSLQI